MGVDDYESSSVTMKETGGEEQPLLESGKASDESVITVAPSGFGYNYGHRPYRDTAFSIAFAVFVAASLGVGIFAAFNQNPDFLLQGSAKYDPSEGCTLPNESRHGASSIFHSGRHVDVMRSSSLSELFLEMPGLWLGSLFSMMVSVPVAFGLLWALRKHTKQIVYGTLLPFVIVPMIFVIGCLSYIRSIADESYDMTSLYMSLGFMVFADVAYLWILYRNWDRVELTIRIIRTAAEALHQNLGLVLVSPALNFGLLFYFVPAFVCVLCAHRNGKIVTNPALVQDPDLNCGGSSGTACCVWETDSWVPAYNILAYFVTFWALVIVAGIQHFTITGTIAQWYFAVGDSSTFTATKRSFLHAVGPSFGTLCFSGLVGAVIGAIRSATDKSQSDRADIGFVALILRACLSCLLSAVEFLTQFTTEFSAITGESFCASAKMTYDLLRRNFLSTLVVESLGMRLLSQTMIVVAAVAASLVWLVTSICLREWQSFFVGMFPMIILLLFVMMLLLPLGVAVNAVYICFAMDKDHNEVSKPEVHDVYVLLPASQDGKASLAVSTPSAQS